MNKQQAKRELEFTEFMLSPYFQTLSEKAQLDHIYKQARSKFYVVQPKHKRQS